MRQTYEDIFEKGNEIFSKETLRILHLTGKGYLSGGFVRGGFGTGVFVQGFFVRGGFGTGVFVQGFFVRGGFGTGVFVWEVYVLIPSCIKSGMNNLNIPSFDNRT